MTEAPLTGKEVDEFIEYGFVHLRGVVPLEVVAEGQRIVWSDLGKSPDDPSTWTEPMATVFPSDLRPFGAAFDNPRLHGVFDQLVGAGRWQPREHLGVFIVRFPQSAPPNDTRWHVDESVPPEGYGRGLDFSQWRVNLLSGDRALLMLCLFSDIGADDGPTRIRVGSHLDVPSLLHPAGDAGISFSMATVLAEQVSATRAVTFATGGAGDVYLFHPFLVHGAQPVRGNRPRLMSRAPLISNEPVVLDKPAAADSPVEAAIRRGLAGRSTGDLRPRRRLRSSTAIA